MINAGIALASLVVALWFGPIEIIECVVSPAETDEFMWVPNEK